MPVIVWVAVARSVAKSAAQPGFEFGQQFWLESAFDIGGAGALRLNAPAARLNGAPDEP